MHAPRTFRNAGGVEWFTATENEYRVWAQITHFCCFGHQHSIWRVHNAGIHIEVAPTQRACCSGEQVGDVVEAVEGEQYWRYAVSLSVHVSAHEARWTRILLLRPGGLHDRPGISRVAQSVSVWLVVVVVGCALTYS